MGVGRTPLSLGVIVTVGVGVGGNPVVGVILGVIVFVGVTVLVGVGQIATGYVNWQMLQSSLLSNPS